MQEKETVKNKRTLQSTFVMMAIMLATSSRDENEKLFKPIAEALLQVGGPVNDTIDELVDQGYVEFVDGTAKLTRFGEKIVLQSTHNTPNFRRVANSSPNTAFAMLFASYNELKDTHLVNQDKIVAGDKGSTLVENLNNLVGYFQNKLAAPAPPVFEKAKKGAKAA